MTTDPTYGPDIPCERTREDTLIAHPSDADANEEEQERVKRHRNTMTPKRQKQATNDDE